MSLPKSRRKSATALPTCPDGVATAMFIVLFKLPLKVSAQVGTDHFAERGRPVLLDSSPCRLTSSGNRPKSN